MIRTRFTAVLLAAAAFAASAGPAAAAPGGKGGGTGDTQSNAPQAQDDHKPAGTGSGRKIG